MSTQNLQYIYEAEEFNDSPTDGEFYSGPVLMGREREYFTSRQQAVQEFIELQSNADLETEREKEVKTDGQLFGISNQNNKRRVSLDKKFPGDILYTVKVDNMSPLIPINSTVLLKFCDQHASGEVCIYRYRGQTYCNQIKLINNKVVAFSLNPKYKPITLDPNHYYFIAVVSSIHRFIKNS